MGKHGVTEEDTMYLEIGKKFCRSIDLDLEGFKLTNEASDIRLKARQKQVERPDLKGDRKLTESLFKAAKAKQREASPFFKEASRLFEEAVELYAKSKREDDDG